MGKRTSKDRIHEPTQENAQAALKLVVSRLLKEVEVYRAIASRHQQDHDDGYYYLEFDLGPEISHEEMDLSVNGDHGLLRFARTVGLSA